MNNFIVIRCLAASGVMPRIVSTQPLNSCNFTVASIFEIWPPNKSSQQIIVNGRSFVVFQGTDPNFHFEFNRRSFQFLPYTPTCFLHLVPVKYLSNLSSPNLSIRKIHRFVKRSSKRKTYASNQIRKARFSMAVLELA